LLYLLVVMDDTRNGYLTSFVFSVGLTLALAGHAIELEYISPAKHTELEQAFARADFSNDAAGIKHKTWTCDMYGVRTRLQVRRGVKLYRWSNASDWQNAGAQVVTNYQVAKDSLNGRTDRYEDQVKVTADGRIISRLSALKPTTTVLAYSVCSSP
jgi:hypothetical protein